MVGGAAGLGGGGARGMVEAVTRGLMREVGWDGSRDTPTCVATGEGMVLTGDLVTPTCPSILTATCSGRLGSTPTTTCGLPWTMAGAEMEWVMGMVNGCFKPTFGGRVGRACGLKTLTVAEEVLMGCRRLAAVRAPTLELTTTAEGSGGCFMASGGRSEGSKGAEAEGETLLVPSSTSSAVMLGCWTITCTSPPVT